MPKGGHNKLNLVGFKSGKLIVVSMTEDRINRCVVWRCSCDCGGFKNVLGYLLKKKAVKRCDNCRTQKGINGPRYTHGGTYTRLFRTWMGIKFRCYNENSKDYKYYGAKGVSVHPGWHKFEVFRDWANNNGYENSLTLERINPDGNYQPDNCEWITRSENSRRAARGTWENIFALRRMCFL